MPDTGSHPSGNREDDRQQRTEPEVRHGDAEQRHRHGHLVDPLPAIERAEHAERQRDQNGDSHRGERELGGATESLTDLSRHGRVVAERRAQIAARQAEDIRRY